MKERGRVPPVPRLCCIRNSDAESHNAYDFRLHPFMHAGYVDRHPGLDEFHPNPFISTREAAGSYVSGLFAFAKP
jgi:hypothetical protein